MSKGIRLLKKLSEVGPFLYRGPGKMWVSASTLKCMYTSYVQKQIDDKQLEMPWAINHTLSYLLKEGLAEIRPTQTGCELVKAFLESYKVSHERWERKAEGRRQVRQNVRTGSFSLDGITPHGIHVDVKGHYGDVIVEASTKYKCIKLRRNGVRTTYVQRGSLYNKIITDITNVLKSPAGRLWVVRVSAKHIERFLNNHVTKSKNRKGVG